MPATSPDLWALTFGKRWIDSTELTAALEQAAVEAADYRTQLLIRDSLDALVRRWGRQRVDTWLARSLRGPALRRVWSLKFDEVGFPTLDGRLMEPLTIQSILSYLRELGVRLRQPTRITIGGSIALILSDELRRATDDIDVVDELPAEIRSDHDLMNELAAAYGLRLTHFQSHYLPVGWAGRVRSFGLFDRLSVYTVDSYDIFLSKLLSDRRKDLDDLRILAPQFDKQRIENRLRDSCGPLLASPLNAQNATRNWYILYGQPLPA